MRALRLEPAGGVPGAQRESGAASASASTELRNRMPPQSYVLRNFCLLAGRDKERRSGNKIYGQEEGVTRAAMTLTQSQRGRAPRQEDAAALDFVSASCTAAFAAALAGVPYR